MLFYLHDYQYVKWNNYSLLSCLLLFGVTNNVKIGEKKKKKYRNCMRKITNNLSSLKLYFEQYFYFFFLSFFDI